MTTFETIDTRVEGRIGILTFNRPKVLNAINRQLMAEVTAAVSEFTKDSRVLVLVVHGAGRAFSAGFDMKELAQRSTSGTDQWQAVLQADFDFIMQFGLPQADHRRGARILSRRRIRTCACLRYDRCRGGYEVRRARGPFRLGHHRDASSMAHNAEGGQRAASHRDRSGRRRAGSRPRDCECGGAARNRIGARPSSRARSRSCRAFVSAAHEASDQPHATRLWECAKPFLLR